MPTLWGRNHYVDAASLSNESDFSNAAQQWHVIANPGVPVLSSSSTDVPPKTTLAFSTLINVIRKRRGMIEIDSPVTGWIPIANARGYLHVAKGGADVSVKWRYSVVCPDGAVVRDGMELHSTVRVELPRYSIVEVLERKINKAGLPRLRVADGWISEVLNPLSGQRGPVVEIIPFIRPLLFRVVLDTGAVVRRSVELASNRVKSIEKGELIRVIAKQYSDSANKCMERLKLADGSGWLSMKLNRDPPHDSPIVEYVGVFETPQPRQIGCAVDSRGTFASRGERRISACGPDAETGGVSCWPESDNETAEDAKKIKGSSLTEDDSCVVCLSGLRTATIVHGEIGHIACCLECARILKARGDTCPVCRIPIDIVVQHFWA